MPSRCLVVDDNERFLFVAERLLGSGDVLEVEGAPDIATALEVFDRFQPDVVLIDVSLGVESGFGLAHMLIERAPDIASRIIIISTRSGEDYEGLIEDAAVAGFISKSDLSVEAVQQLVAGLG
ncbi:MAG: response regulator [Lacisediminihabitans sp.]